MKIAIGITDICNHNCWFCYARSSQNGEIIPADELLNFMIEAGCFFTDVSFPLGGGEPTAHPDFEEIVSELEKRMIPYSVTTNLEHPEKLLNIRNGWVWGSIHDPEETEEIVKKLRTLHANKGVNVLVMKSYLPYIHDIIRVIIEHKLPYILTMFKPYGRAEGADHEVLSHEEKVRLIRDLFMHYRQPVATDSCQMLTENEFCRCGVSWVTISADRTVRPNSFYCGISIQKLSLESFIEAYKAIPKRVHNIRR